MYFHFNFWFLFHFCDLANLFFLSLLLVSCIHLIAITRSSTYGCAKRNWGIRKFETKIHRDSLSYHAWRLLFYYILLLLSLSFSRFGICIFWPWASFWAIFLSQLCTIMENYNLDACLAMLGGLKPVEHTLRIAEDMEKKSDGDSLW